MENIAKTKLNMTMIVCLAALFAASLCRPLWAQPQEPNEVVNLFEMSLEELMEVPVVVSASRQARPIDRLSVPVTVITADDIHLERSYFLC